MFEIKENKSGALKQYTHTINFKGKLLSGQGYYSANFFEYDEYEEINPDRFLALKVSDIPGYLKLKTFGKQLYKEFTVSWMRKQGNKILFSIDANLNDFENSVWNPIMFCKTMKKKSAAHHFKIDIRYLHEEFVTLDRVYKVSEVDRLKKLFLTLQKDFAELYSETQKAMLRKVDTL